MHQSAKVRAIYRELRQVAELHASAADVLAIATSLVELFSLDECMPSYDLREGRQPFDMLPVDSVMADGGWRMLSREWKRMGWETSDGCGGVRHNEWAFA